jgi:LysR family transcriptional activator of dmlA
MNALSDLAFFSILVKQGSLAAVARELGVTPPAVTKRLATLERRLGVRLLNRTTRTMSVTHEGEIYLAEGSRILSEIEELERTVSRSRAVPKGLLRVNATFGFGRKYIAPAISDFAAKFPEIEVLLQLSDRPLNLADQAFDIGIRIGEMPDARIIARKIASNRRLLCAAPAYLKQCEAPLLPRDLQKHKCIVLRENDAAYATWHLSRGKRQETVKVRGTLSSNDGESTLNWALAGHGILMGCGALSAFGPAGRSTGRLDIAAFGYFCRLSGTRESFGKGIGICRLSLGAIQIAERQGGRRQYILVSGSAEMALGACRLV